MSRENSIGDAFWAYDIECHALSKSLIEEMAREYLPPNAPTPQVSSSVGW